VENHPGDEMHLLFGPESSVGTQHIVRGVDDALRDCGVEAARCRRYFGCRNMDNAFAAVDSIRAALRPGTRPALIAYGAAFLEYMVMGLNRSDPGALSRVDIAGFAMRTSMDKLGLDFPCIMHNPEAAGIAAAEMLHNRVVARGQPPPEQSRFEVKAIRHLQKGRGRLH
jgi:DNA-binding LacI/PurR family transcriptional regulator